MDRPGERRTRKKRATPASGWKRPHQILGSRYDLFQPSEGASPASPMTAVLAGFIASLNASEMAITD